MSIKDLLKNVDVHTLKELKSLSEAEMYDLVGEKMVSEGDLQEDSLKETVLEFAETAVDRADFYEKIKSIGLSRNSAVVKAAEVLVKV